MKTNTNATTPMIDLTIRSILAYAMSGKTHLAHGYIAYSVSPIDGRLMHICSTSDNSIGTDEHDGKTDYATSHIRGAAIEPDFETEDDEDGWHEYWYGVINMDILAIIRQHRASQR